MILSWFSRQTFWWIKSRWIMKLLVFGPCRALRGARAQFQKCVYNSTFLILSWYLCQTCGGVFKFDCCLWAKDTIAKMCKQFNILDFILICVPNNWGSYWGRLLSLGPEGGGCTNSKMCVHFNIFLFYPDVVPKIWGSIQVGLLSVGGHNF